MNDNHFSIAQSELFALGERILDLAKKQGATAAETELSDGRGQGVTVRNGEIETIEYNRDKSISITVYQGCRKGTASTSNFSEASIQDTVEKAVSIASQTAEDPFSGLADAAQMPIGESLPDLNLFHPWALDIQEATDLALACEQAAFDENSLIQNSEGASVSSHATQFVLLNSCGFAGGFKGSRHSLSCSVIAGSGESMQRDGWYDVARDAMMLSDVKTIGAKTAQRAAARVGARKIQTTKVPVLFEAPVAAGLLRHFVSAASGGKLYRKASFLVDRLGEALFPSFVQLSERPHLPKALASMCFDADAVRTQDREIVSDGCLQGYFLNAYTARKLGMTTTGNAGGAHNLILSDTGEGFDALVRKMGKGLIVTELLGDGVDYVTGNYSRGASGFWVEHGEIQYPVEEITIAGNLLDMYQGISAIGNDRLIRGNCQCGSILIDQMMVAGD